MMDKVAKRSSAKSKLLSDAGIGEKDVLTIWDALSRYIRDEMSRKRGVLIPGFGTFTYVEQRLDIGNKKELLKLKPFFLLSDKFAQTHSIQFEKEHVNTAIPVHRVNYAAVSEVTKRKYSRQIVETVLNEAFMAIDHFIRAEGVISIPFVGVGSFKLVGVNPKPKAQSFFQFSSAMESYLPIY